MSRIHEPAEPSRAMSALCGQVDRLIKKQTADQARTDTEVTALQEAVAAIADSLTGLSQRPAAAKAKAPAAAGVEWLTIDDPAMAGALLLDLADWIGAVWNHYEDRIRPCWAFHPAAVAELLATKSVWSAALADDAKPTALADWHERYRPGANARIRKYIKCEAVRGGHVTTNSVGRETRWSVTDPDLTQLGTWWALTHGTTDDPTPGLEIHS